MSLDRSAEVRRKQLEPATKLFDSPPAPLTRGQMVDRMRMSPFHLALLLHVEGAYPNPGDAIYFGMKPSRENRISSGESVEGTIRAWNHLEANGAKFHSLRAAALEAKSSQGRGNKSSADGWKSSYIDRPGMPGEYESLAEAFRHAFVTGAIPEDGYSYEMLCRAEYLAAQLVIDEVIDKSDAYDMLRKMGYVKARLSGTTSMFDEEDSKTYWRKLSASLRTFKGNVTRKRNSASDLTADSAPSTQSQPPWSALDDYDESEGCILPYEPMFFGPESRLGDGEKFSFAGDVARDFESKVIQAQVSGYHQMRRLTLSMISHFATRREMRVCDFGCSQGKTILDLVRHLHETGQSEVLLSSSFLGYDQEEDMLKRARESRDNLFSELFKSGIPHVEWRRGDISEVVQTLPANTVDIAIMILTAQFIPVEKRSRVYSNIYRSLRPGGALILVEKERAESATIEDMFTSIHHQEKSRLGMSRDAIVRKSRAIENFLVPDTRRTTMLNLRQAGFSEYSIGTFWQDLHFAGHVAVK